MKRKLHPTGQFKTDFKRIRNNPRKVAAFERIAALLIEGLPIPPEHKPHALKGRYRGCMECHVEDDLLLIWIDGDVVSLLRLGSHSELF